jgi:amidase
MGLKTTFGLVPIKGVFPIEPKHLDTVGPLARDTAHLVQGMDLLQNGFAARYRSAVATKPSARQIRIGRLYLSGTERKIDQAVDQALAKTHFRVVSLSPAFTAKWETANKDGNTVAAAGAWISDQGYLLKLRVRPRTKAIILLGRILYPGSYEAALRRRLAWQRDLRKIFRKVDFIALPTLQTMPAVLPVLGNVSILDAVLLGRQNTVAVNYAGNPALAIPVTVNDKHVPVTSLQLVGPRLSEARLLNAGRLIEAEEPQVDQIFYDRDQRKRSKRRMRGG